MGTTASLDEVVQRAGLNGYELIRLDGGSPNQVYRVKGAGVVLRIMKHPTRWYADSHLPGLLKREGLPVPDVISSGQVGGIFYILLSELPGVRLHDAMATAPSRTFADAGACLARIHEIRFDHYGQFGQGGLRGQYNDWLATVTANLVTALEAPAIRSKLSSCDRDRALALLHENEDQLKAGFPVLLHMDYQPKNILVSPDDYHITGILDFEHACIGQPGLELAKARYDFASRVEALDAFMAGYNTVKALPSAKEIDLYRLMHAVNMMSLATDRQDETMCQRFLADFRLMLRDHGLAP